LFASSDLAGQAALRGRLEPHSTLAALQPA
jgi:hypothetical protein